MTSIASKLRFQMETVKTSYGDNLPTFDAKLYEGRTYTLAAASCFAAAYGAAHYHRDHMAIQFYHIAMRLADALTPEYPKEIDDKKNVIPRKKDIQISLDSQLCASQMDILAEYGLLYFLNMKHEQFTFLELYKTAQEKCMAAHEEAKSLRHSSIDKEFEKESSNAAEAIAVHYMNELTIFDTAVRAGLQNQEAKLGPDIYIVETVEQRKRHQKADVDKMLQVEQVHIGQLKQERETLLAKLQELNKRIMKQVDVSKTMTTKLKELEKELELHRKNTEKETGLLSEMHRDRSDVRVELAKVDGDYHRLMARLQALVNFSHEASQ